MSAEIRKAPEDSIAWINPIGGYGDMLMLSGVLKQLYDIEPSKRFNLVRRTNYTIILKGHPIFNKIGFPPKGAKIEGVDYWHMEKLGPDNQRPYQILARAFGLQTPIEEKLYLPNEINGDPLLHDFIPWKRVNILIAPTSDSPRKIIKPSIWQRIVHYLELDGARVLQAGRLNDPHIQGAYSIRGLTTPQQLIALIKKCSLVITSDNFVMHASHLTGTKAVAIWGPTDHRVYGYEEQIHIQLPKTCGLGEEEECIGPDLNQGGKLYNTKCPQKENHCIDQVKPEEVYEATRKALAGL